MKTDTHAIGTLEEARNPNRSKCVPKYKREEARKLPLVLQAYIRNVFGANAGSIQARTRFGHLGAEVGEARNPNRSKCVSKYCELYFGICTRHGRLGVMPKRPWRVRV